MHCFNCNEAIQGLQIRYASFSNILTNSVYSSSDAAHALILLMHSSCLCTDVADALMHLGYCTESRSESFAHLSIAFYSSFSCFEGSLVFSPFDIFLVPVIT